ncbi:MAG: hypothetical protein WDZ30_11080 [Cellvibrionaceae bacterium]
MKSLDKNIIIALVLISFLLSIVEIYLNLQEEVVSDTTTVLWALAFAFLVAIWATKDPKKSEFDTPFEFGFIMYLFWPLMLPYYLVKTRGLEGLVLFIGFVAIYLIPYFSGLVAYVYFS